LKAKELGVTILDEEAFVNKLNETNKNSPQRELIS
jgi:hypothetical protein